MIRILIAFLFALCLAACGGGGGEAPAATNSPTVAAAPSGAASAPAQPSAPLAAGVVPIKIAMFGDSTTKGATMNSNGVIVYPPGTSEPEQLQLLMNARYGAGAVTVENHGVSGSTCYEWLYGGAPVPNDQTWNLAMAATDAQIVTMNCAINDTFLAYESPSDFRYAYNQFATSTHSYGKVFVVEAANPIVMPDPKWAPMLATLVQQQYGSATETGSVFVDQWDSLVALMPDWQSHLSDGVHPDATMYALKAQISASVLYPVVDAEMCKLNKTHCS